MGKVQIANDEITLILMSGGGGDSPVEQAVAEAGCAVEILAHLRSPRLEKAQAALKKCEAAMDERRMSG